MQQLILQIEAAIRIALPTCHSLDGQLKLQPIRQHQFCCSDMNRVIEYQRMQIDLNGYKLSTPEANQDTQQAQKHPNSV